MVLHGADRTMRRWREHHPRLSVAACASFEIAQDERSGCGHA
jgi:hypothetical protein